MRILITFLLSLLASGLFIAKERYLKKSLDLETWPLWRGLLGLWVLFYLGMGFLIRDKGPLQAFYFCLVLGQVLWMGYLDLKTGGFYRLDYGCLGILALIHLVQNPSWSSILASLLAGLFFFLIEKLTHGFGEGDKYFVFITGLFINPPRLVYHYLSASFILAGGICGVLMVIYHWDRKKEIPLGPFLSAGFLGIYIFKEYLCC